MGLVDSLKSGADLRTDCGVAGPGVEFLDVDALLSGHGLVEFLDRFEHFLGQLFLLLEGGLSCSRSSLFELELSRGTCGGSLAP